MSNPIRTCISIQVNGPGTLVNWPAALVVKALKQAGFEVILKSNERTNTPEEIPTEPPHPPWQNGSSGDVITVIENHMPWSG